MSRPLRVILNDRPLRTTLTGVGHYIHELLLHMESDAPDVRVDPFLFGCVLRQSWRRHDALAGADTTPPAIAQPRDVGGSRKPWWVRRTLDAGLGVVFRAYARTGRYALYHEPNHIPLRCGLPTVTTVHDLSVIVHPDWHPDDRVRWYERGFEAGLRQTRRFIAVSEFTRRELVARCNVPPDRIDVVYEGPRAAFRPQPREIVRRVLTALQLSPGFFLYVGTLEPRKNLIGLLDAYAALPGRLRQRHPLAVVGAWGWKQAALRERLSERDLMRDVRLLGYVADPHLACLYSGCAALVWPTLYEGFGLPPLEAMTCGAAVAVSNGSSLPEVVGDAGLLLDPHDPPAWSEAMRRLAEDEAWRAALARRGARQAAGFSWARCVEQTVACYRAALAGS